MDTSLFSKQRYCWFWPLFRGLLCDSCLTNSNLTEEDDSDLGVGDSDDEPEAEMASESDDDDDSDLDAFRSKMKLAKKEEPATGFS